MTTRTITYDDATHVLVPRVPTTKMLETARDWQRTSYVYDEYVWGKFYQGIYHAMLGAAPKPPAPRPYDPNGHLAEYGIIPECDAAKPEQPAATVPSDEDIRALWKSTPETMWGSDVLRFARALLERYRGMQGLSADDKGADHAEHILDMVPTDEDLYQAMAEHAQIDGRTGNRSFDHAALIAGARAVLERYGQPAASAKPLAWVRPDLVVDGKLVASTCSIHSSHRPGYVPLYAAPVAAQPWQTLAAALYQAAGAYDMPVRILDALSAAANGEPFEHLIGGLLPIEHVSEADELPVVNDSLTTRNETLMREHEMFGRHFDVLRTIDGHYIGDDDECRWEGWRARAALAQQPSPSDQSQSIAELLHARGYVQSEADVGRVAHLLAQVLQPSGQDREDVRPDRDAVDLAREGMALHQSGQPEYIVCKELVRVAEGRPAKGAAVRNAGATHDGDD